MQRPSSADRGGGVTQLQRTATGAHCQRSVAAAVQLAAIAGSPSWLTLPHTRLAWPRGVVGALLASTGPIQSLSAGARCRTAAQQQEQRRGGGGQGGRRQRPAIRGAR